MREVAFAFFALEEQRSCFGGGAVDTSASVGIRVGSTGRFGVDRAGSGGSGLKLGFNYGIGKSKLSLPPSSHPPIEPVWKQPP